jgi:transposase
MITKVPANPPSSERYRQISKVIKFFERGLNYTQIGEQLGIHRVTVQRWLRKAGKVQANPPRYERYAKVIELFERRLSYVQIGKEVGLHPATVKKWLISAGKAQARPPSSERYAHIPIAKLIELHDLGMNNRQIGQKLGMHPSTVGHWLRKAGKVVPKAVTTEERKESVLDPAWEARRDIKNRVVCRKCGQLKASLNDPKDNHLSKHHMMTAADYTSKYPGARLMSFDLSASHNRWLGSSKTANERMAEFAASYLTPAELKEYLKDHEWEEHHQIKDFVACRLCGFKCKFRLSDHLMSRHSISSAAYRLRFPKSLLLPLSKEDSERDRSRKKGRALRDLAKKGKILKGCRDADEVVDTIAKLKAALAQRVSTMPHRPPEDKRAARVNQLRKQGLRWSVVHARIEQEFKIHTTLSALQMLLKRYLEREKAA